MLLKLINYVFPHIHYAYGENAAISVDRVYFIRSSTPLSLSDATRDERRWIVSTFLVKDGGHAFSLSLSLSCSCGYDKSRTRVHIIVVVVEGNATMI